MTKVKVLIEGYAKQLPDSWVASSSTTLIQQEGLNILVDPGTNKELLLSRLAKELLSPEDINIVLLTHHHPDHVLNTALFQNSKVVDNATVYENDKETEHGGKVPGTELEIIPTPGHNPEHCSFMIRTGEGSYVVAGDVFWWTDQEDEKTDENSLLSREDPYAIDKETLKQSRKKLIKLAVALNATIIPGHGKPFIIAS